MPLRVTLFKSPERNLKTNCLLFFLLLLLTHRVYQKQSNGILQNSKIWCISSAPSFLFGEDQPHIWWKGWYQRGIGSKIEKILDSIVNRYNLKTAKIGSSELYYECYRQDTVTVYTCTCIISDPRVIPSPRNWKRSNFSKMVRTLTLNDIYTCPLGHDASNGIKAMGHWESWSPWKTKLKLPNFVKTIKILIPKPYTVCEIIGRPIDKIEHVSIVRRIFVDRLVYRRNAACHRWNVLPNAFLNASW